MASLILQHPPGWDWRRVGAWSSSLAVHAIAVALLALPVLGTRRPAAPQPAPTVVTLHEPPAVLPIPSLPMPERRPPKPAARTPSPRTPIAPPVQPSAAPIPPAPIAATPEPEPASPPAIEAPAQPAGITQSLAYVQAPKLPYPPASVRAREQGRVLLRVLVDADGAPKEVGVERSSGYPKLDAAARDAVLKSRFRPVMRDGKAIPAWGLVPIEFRLAAG